MAIAELQVQLNWIKELQEGLEGGFKRAYIYSMEEYIRRIDKVVSYMPPSVKKKILRRSDKYRDIDFRIPSKYEKGREKIVEMFYDIISQSNGANEELYRKIESLTQEGMQDLGNIVRYVVDPSAKSILPREEVKEIKFTSFLTYLHNRGKVNQEYWRDKPVTEIILTASYKYFYILENLKKGYVYVDGKDGRYKLSLTPQELPSSKEVFYELIHHLSYKERIKERIDNFLERNYLHRENRRKTLIFTLLSSLLFPMTVPLYYILTGKERKETYSSYFKEMATVFSILYFLNLYASAPLLQTRANMEKWKDAHISTHHIKRVEYRLERKEKVEFLSLLRDHPEIGAMGVLLTSFLGGEIYHKTLLSEENYRLTDIVITLKDGFHYSIYSVIREKNGRYMLVVSKSRDKNKSIEKVHITLSTPLPYPLYNNSPLSILKYMNEGRLDATLYDTYSRSRYTVPVLPQDLFNKIMHELEESLKNKREKMKGGENENI